MRSLTLTDRSTFLVSLIGGLALWEIAGRYASPAFLVPFSETVARLYELALDGRLWAQFLDSATLFLTGFALALAIGMPAGLLLARALALRIGIEPYIMLLYATPMVALIPFILSLMGFGFFPKVLVVFLFAVFPILYNTVEGARSIKPELIAVERMGVVARGDASLHAALHHDRRAAGDRTWTRGDGRRGVFSQCDGLGPGDHGCIAEFRHCDR